MNGSENITNYSIKTEKIDDKLNTKLMEVILNGKKFTTPHKTLSLYEPYSLHEIYQRTNANKISLSENGHKVELNTIPSKCKNNAINFIIPEYEDVRISDNALTTLECHIHPYTDVVIIPRWDGVLKLGNDNMLLDNIWGLTERYIEEIRRKNGKLIMGNLPINRPQNMLTDLLHNYLNAGVSSFVLDYEGCQGWGKASILRILEKELETAGHEEDSILYSVNMRKSHDYNNLQPADDFLTFIEGVDILGNFHFGGGGDQTKVKIFNPNDWTYVTEDIMGRSASVISEENRMKIVLETEHIKHEIFENGTAYKLAKTKRGADEYTRPLAQTSLMDFHGIGWN